jgi:hypothetical protein
MSATVMLGASPAVVTSPDRAHQKITDCDPDDRS